MAAATAAMHVKHMPNDLASQLGLEAVRDIFHLGTVEYPGGLGFVALCDGVVVGYCLAHIDFRVFSTFQKRDFLRFYGKVLPGLLRQPSLITGVFGAQKYLRTYPAFVNLGPLLVRPDFRNPIALADQRVSVAGELARMTFAKVREKAPEWPVLTMIRPDNMPSISAVAQGARRERYRLVRKSPIAFGRDVRTIYEYSALPATGAEPVSENGK